MVRAQDGRWQQFIAHTMRDVGPPQQHQRPIVREGRDSSLAEAKVWTAQKKYLKK